MPRFRLGWLGAFLVTLVCGCAATWFVGAITDEEARTLDVPLSFLTPGRRYVAEIYADGPKANWLDNPLPVTVTRRAVNSASREAARQYGSARPNDN